MAAEFLLIGEGDRVGGFRFAGFDVIGVNSETDMTLLMEDVARQGRYGLVCIEERFFNKVSRNTIKRIKKKGLPVVMAIDMPGEWGRVLREGEESALSRLIRRSIGYQIKIKR